MRDSSASRYGNRFRTRRLMPPPHGLFLGNLDRSSRRTVTPARASVRAAVAPAGPAPTTKTNDVFGKREPLCSKADHHGGHGGQKESLRNRKFPVSSVFSPWWNFELSGVPLTNQIRQQLVRAIDTGGQFAPEAQADVDPPPLSPLGRHERTEFLALVIRERFVNGE